jgi:excisionase family DNA binding protein
MASKELPKPVDITSRGNREVDRPMGAKSTGLENETILVDKRRVPDRRVNPDRRNGHSPLTLIRRVFNTGEACRYLQISRPTFLKLITAGKIRAQKIGKGWKVLESELEQFLRSEKSGVH